MTKDTLKEYRKLTIELEQLGEEILRLKEALSSPHTRILSAAPKGSRPVSMADRLVRVEALSEAYCKKFDEVLAEREKIEAAIDSLFDPLERTVLRYRYIEGLTWEKIGYKIQYEWAQVHRLHNRALKNLQMKKHDTQ